jgi:antitoxin (DNA-binding transcriptional repressor) of toxin-antitoxin stability system
MTIHDPEMDISVSDFKARCPDLIHRVEKSGRPITITRPSISGVSVRVIATSLEGIPSA